MSEFETLKVCSSCEKSQYDHASFTLPCGKILCTWCNQTYKCSCSICAIQKMHTKFVIRIECLECSVKYPIEELTSGLCAKCLDSMFSITDLIGLLGARFCKVLSSPFSLCMNQHEAELLPEPRISNRVRVRTNPTNAFVKPYDFVLP